MGKMDVDKDVQEVFLEYKDKYEKLREEYASKLREILKDKRLSVPYGAVRESDGTWGNLKVAVPPAFATEIENHNAEAYEACKNMFLGVGLEFIGEPMSNTDNYLDPFNITQFTSQEDLTSEQKEKHRQFLLALSVKPNLEMEKEN
ncbi:hypothetical protein bpr_II098 (plasmid) [Butyrivibrio proteoclasticus B316]|uniref:Uncharacterized protein n=1 Tax=Butyrivibrio proteoclasticus (strain ATCC 51982 / DSM 14932 / B316) TaxID=515622 RepID=E0S3Q5_BUTPB|nr:hypothetical protein [Butyrivibrio proteoclasticus]ADL36037.1 hypothetical protein bpr_II098 [Butyrivibrio proteoclasticus B316]